MSEGGARGVTPGTVIAVVGPTAVGKTRLAEDLAVRLGGEVVSADSMQVYRGMDIGTAKTPVEARRVPHHCVDIADPGCAYSAALFQVDARDAIEGIIERGGTPVVAGGTGLYVRAALDDWSFPSGSAESPARDRLKRLADEIGPVALHARLAEIDPASAALVHPNNVRRTIRALELAGEGVSYAAQHAGFLERRSVYPTILIGLTLERQELYRRIDERVEHMMSAGLLGEVRRLLEAGYREALTAAQAIGYKELVTALERGSDLGEAVRSIQRASRRYAKRQLTWFRADPRIAWIDVTGRDAEEVAELSWQHIVSTGGAEPRGRVTG